MSHRRIIPALLLLTLAAPMPRSSVAGPIATAPQVRRTANRAAGENELLGLSGPSLDHQRTSDELSSDDVTAAGEYLRRRDAGETPSAELAAAWNRFYKISDQHIRRFCHQFTRQRADVDDCAQEVWTDVIVKLPAFKLDESRGKFSSWIYTIARNKAMDLRRTSARRPTSQLESEVAQRLVASDLNPIENLQRRDDRSSVRRAMDQLKIRGSASSYQILDLRFSQSLSAAEVSRDLDISREQVWVREHRAKQKLKAILVATDLTLTQLA